MKLHLARTPGNVVTAMGEGWIRIGADEYRENVIVAVDRVVTGWAPGGFEGMRDADFELFVRERYDIVLLGTGATQRFPAAEVVRPLVEARIGVEVMDTKAACRTYNILVSESRRVAAALIVRDGLSS